MVQKKSMIKSEIIHLTGNEGRKVSVPLRRDAGPLKMMVSQSLKASPITGPIRSLETKRVSKARNTMRSFSGRSKQSPFFSTFD